MNKEGYCPRCKRSFALEARQCLHCGYASPTARPGLIRPLEIAGPAQGPAAGQHTALPVPPVPRRMAPGRLIRPAQPLPDLPESDSTHQPDPHTQGQPTPTRWGVRFTEVQQSATHEMAERPGNERMLATSRAAERWRTSWRERQQAGISRATGPERQQPPPILWLVLLALLLFIVVLALSLVLRHVGGAILFGI